MLISLLLCLLPLIPNDIMKQIMTDLSGNTEIHLALGIQSA